MKYENFFLRTKDNGVGEFTEFTVNNQYGLYYFLNNNISDYVSSTVPMLDMKRVYNKIITNRRFLKILLRTFSFRSHKLTRLLRKFYSVGGRSAYNVTLKNLFIFIFKIFSTQECM